MFICITRSITKLNLLHILFIHENYEIQFWWFTMKFTVLIICNFTLTSNNKKKKNEIINQHNRYSLLHCCYVYIVYKNGRCATKPSASCKERIQASE